VNSRPACDIEALADDAWLLRFGDRIEPGLNAAVHAMTARLRALDPPWLREVVPAFASLGVFFDAQEDPARVHAKLLALVEELASSGDGLPLPLRAGGGWEGVVRREGAELNAMRDVTALRTSPLANPFLQAGEEARSSAANVIEIPVLYGGEHGPDLESSAAELGLSPQALIERHAAGDYTVAMIGFAPGFPYLSGLDPALALPRLATPRTSVAAGSVAIGGAQTGIYPRESPGGWRLLGRTPWVLFDPRHEPPARLQPGDRVRFVAIDADEFARLADAQDAAP